MKNTKKQLKKFEIRWECGTEEEFEADSYDEAVEIIIEKTQQGDYGDESCYVNVYLVEWNVELGDYDYENEECLEVLVENDPEEPECIDSKGCKWEQPEWLGGCTENPGVWSLQGTQIKATRVCSRCGMYEIYVSESTPGQYPREAPHTRYEDADEKSEKWVLENTELDCPVCGSMVSALEMIHVESEDIHDSWVCENCVPENNESGYAERNERMGINDLSEILGNF